VTITERDRKRIAQRLRLMAQGVEDGTERVIRYVDTPARFELWTESPYPIVSASFLVGNSTCFRLALASGAVQLLPMKSGPELSHSAPLPMFA
jgi:hypothetical protein